MNAIRAGVVAHGSSLLTNHSAPSSNLSTAKNTKSKNNQKEFFFCNIAFYVIILSNKKK
jgi:hypothetical protein